MRTLPCELDGDRFLLAIPLGNGRVARMLVDTGGGFALHPALADGLPIVTGDDGVDRVAVTLDPPVPGPLSMASLSDAVIGDGVLPAAWFAGHAWRFDYAAEVLGLLGPEDALPTGDAIGLGYPERAGERLGPFPRVTAFIDDEPVDLLLDTGATAVLTDTGLAAWGEPRVRASSFVVRSRLERWRAEHPEWPVVEHPTTIAATAITVPEVSVRTGSGRAIRLGSVTFESRPGETFHIWMSQWMDRRIDGALGGNALTGRVLTLDVPGARAWVT